jgi:DMSO/TMAO reductase YedYZ molybdopterin-dependent catalytic subunit
VLYYCSTQLNFLTIKAKNSNLQQVYENAIAGTQLMNQETCLNISGDVQTPSLLSYNEVTKGHQSSLKIVSIYSIEGWNVKILWQDVIVSDLLRQVGANINDSTLIFRAQDGYSTALPMDYYS